VNINTINARERELKSRADALQRRMDVSTKNMSAETYTSIRAEFNAIQAEKKALNAERDAYNAGLKMNNWGDAGTAPRLHGDGRIAGTPVSEHFGKDGKRITTLGADLNPFVITEKTLDLVSESIQSGHAFQVKLMDGANVETKSFNTVESLLPAELMPGVVERIHEPRIADLLPMTGSDTLNYEYISDSTTSNTVTGLTAEGVAAPDVVLNFTEDTLQAQAIKATFGASYETLADRPSLLGYLTAEVFKQFSDEENSLLLNGTSGIVGLTQTSGITTVAVPDSLPTGANTFDYVIATIDAMRVSKSLAVADKAFVHPSTFHALTAQNKDTLGRWLSTPDPTVDIIERIFGVRIYLSTAMAAGQMLFLDTDRFGFVVLREGLRLLSPGYNASDFSEFIQRWAVIERLNLAVVRPTAVGLLTNLPSTFAV
jgi:HK97 family phage major capsid protein